MSDLNEKKVGEREVLFQRTRCQDCGSEHFVFKETTDQETKLGHFTESMAVQGVGLITQGLVVDPTKSVLTAPQIMIIEDVCLDCGLRQVILVTRTRVQVSIKMMPPQGGPQPGYGFPRTRG